MYYLCKICDTVGVPPKEFGNKLESALLKIVQEQYEGIVDEDLGVIVAITKVDKTGEGKVIPGDGSAYYPSDITMLVYKPEVHELVEGEVSEVTEFGAFVRIGPIEGLVHVSQIMDDFINYDAKLPGFVGKKSGKKLTVADAVTARIVTVSLKGNIQSSKIGLTMRQPLLGKPDWTKIEEKGTKAKTPAVEEKTGKKESKPAKKAKPKKAIKEGG